MDATTPDASPQDRRAAAQAASALGARTLITIIVAMPVVFLAAVIGVIMVFGSPDGKKTDKPAAAPAYTAVTSDAVAPIALPDGAKPVGMALDGDRLALRVDGPDGETIIVYDLAEGRILTTIPVLKGVRSLE